MDRQSFVQNGAPKYNGVRSSLSSWLTTPLGASVLDWELAQFDSAVDDVFGYRAVQIGLPEVDFLRQSRIPHRFSLALELGIAHGFTDRFFDAALHLLGRAFNAILIHFLNFSGLDR